MYFKANALLSSKLSSFKLFKNVFMCRECIIQAVITIKTNNASHLKVNWLSYKTKWCTLIVMTTANTVICKVWNHFFFFLHCKTSSTAWFQLCTLFTEPSLRSNHSVKKNILSLFITPVFYFCSSPDGFTAFGPVPPLNFSLCMSHFWVHSPKKNVA